MDRCLQSQRKWILQLQRKCLRTQTEGPSVMRVSAQRHQGCRQHSLQLSASSSSVHVPAVNLGPFECPAAQLQGTGRTPIHFCQSPKPPLCYGLRVDSAQGPIMQVASLWYRGGMMRGSGSGHIFSDCCRETRSAAHVQFLFFVFSEISFFNLTSCTILHWVYCCLIQEKGDLLIVSCTPKEKLSLAWFTKKSVNL